MKAKRIESVFVFVAIAQVLVLLMIWALSVIFDLLVCCVYRLSRWGLCDQGIWLLDRLCERGSAEMSIEDNDDAKGD